MRLFIFMIFTILCLNISAQDSMMLTDNPYWIYNYDFDYDENNSNTHSNSTYGIGISVKGEKSIKGKIYKKLYLVALQYAGYSTRSTDNGDANYALALREEGGKVLVDYDEYMNYLRKEFPKNNIIPRGDSLFIPYHKTQDGELVLYDFNMQIGDKYNHIEGYQDISVVDIKQIVFDDGKNRKLFTLSNGEKIIEGIGCINSCGLLFDYLNPCKPSYNYDKQHFAYLSQFSNDNTIILYEDIITNIPSAKGTSFLDSKKVWHTVWNNTVETVHKYYYVDENIIQIRSSYLKKCQKMYVKTSPDDNQGEFVAYIGEANGKLYRSRDNTTRFFDVIYDSNLPEGGLTESGYKVVKTDEIIVGDRTTRRYKYEKTQGNEKLEYIWVDGIGSLCGPLVAEARLPGNYETLVDVEVDGKVIATHELLTQADGFVVNLNETSLEQSVKDIKTPIHYLTISGKPKADDLGYIRNMIMPDIKGLNLRNLDLDTIPTKAFYTTISNNKRIILPKTLKHLADSALCSKSHLLMGPNDYGLIFELTSPTFPTLGKDVYAEKLEYQDYATMPFIVPSADNEAFRCNANSDILYSADGTIAYYCNNGYEIAKGTRIINGGFMENGQIPGNFYISATVDSIGDRAFANVGLVAYTGYPVEDMTCYAPNPPKLGKDVFVNSMIYHIPVYVPSKSYDIYKNTEVWKDFELRILVDDGIEDITTGKQSSNAFYDLQGRKVKSPTKGLYIKEGKKILVK